ncbi:MAG: hypothetical protein AAGD11_19660 [Planctomycetota bacterium]
MESNGTSFRRKRADGLEQWAKLEGRSTGSTEELLQSASERFRGGPVPPRAVAVGIFVYIALAFGVAVLGYLVDSTSSLPNRDQPTGHAIVAPKYSTSFPR